MYEAPESISLSGAVLFFGKLYPGARPSEAGFPGPGSGQRFAAGRVWRQTGLADLSRRVMSWQHLDHTGVGTWLGAFTGIRRRFPESLSELTGNRRRIALMRANLTWKRLEKAPFPLKRVCLESEK